jgi:Zn-finger nucleic acid-binding protein
MALDVVCPQCRGVYVETNDADGVLTFDDGLTVSNPRVRAYDPERITTGNMLRLKQKYRELGWECFQHDSGTTRDALECPSCGAPLPNLAGKVITREQPEEIKPKRPVGRPRKVTDADFLS